MVAELNLLEVWIPEQMQPGTLFLLEQAGELGKAENPYFMRLAGADYEAAVRGAGGYDLWSFRVFGGVFSRRSGDSLSFGKLKCRDASIRSVSFFRARR
jgi:hypothetical protein